MTFRFCHRQSYSKKVVLVKLSLFDVLVDFLADDRRIADDSKTIVTVKEWQLVVKR